MKGEVVDSRCRICFELNPKVDSYCEKSENGSHRLEQYSFPGHKGRPGKEGGSSPRGGGAEKSGDVDAWAKEHAAKIHSKFDQWLPAKKQAELHKIIQDGGRVRSRYIETPTDRIVNQMKKEGWTHFDTYWGYDVNAWGEALFTKTNGQPHVPVRIGANGP